MARLINVQLIEGGPITQLDEDLLVKREGLIDNEIERTTWIEYRLRSDPDAERAIHRSVHVTLKRPTVTSEGEIGRFL